MSRIKITSTEKAMVRRLVALCTEDGQLVPGHVESALDHLRKQNPPGYRQLLHAFLDEAKKVHKAGQARIESALALQEAEINTITDTMRQSYGRKIVADNTINPDLIAGVRIYIQDDVWDTTVATSLENLKANA